MRVLVVDDEPFQRSTLTARLAVIGVQAEALEDAGQAAALCVSRQFGLIFMDFDMPALHGFDATRRIRAALDREGLPQPLIVGFSADTDGSRKTDALRAGMDLVSDKFIPSKRLQEIICRAAERQRLTEGDDAAVRGARPLRVFAR